MPHHHGHGPAPTRTARALGSSALRSSAGRRLAFVAGPIVLLWIAVALALDLLA